MLRRGSIRGGFVGLALAATVAGQGCADDSVPAQILCNIAPESEGVVCTYSPDTCATSGAMNLGAINSYELHLAVRNGMTPRASEIPLRAETNGLDFYEAEVKILKPSGAKFKFTSGVKNPFRVPIFGHVDPGATSSLAIEAITPNHAEQLLEALNAEKPLVRIVLQVILRGRTNGGEEVELAPWTWPVDLGAADLADPTKKECVQAEQTCVAARGQDIHAGVCDCAFDKDGCGTK